MFSHVTSHVDEHLTKWFYPKIIEYTVITTKYAGWKMRSERVAPRKSGILT